MRHGTGFSWYYRVTCVAIFTTVAFPPPPWRTGAGAVDAGIKPGSPGNDIPPRLSRWCSDAAAWRTFQESLDNLRAGLKDFLLLALFLSFFLSFSPSSIWFLWRAADRIDRNPRRENGRKGSVTIPETIPADHRLEIILQPAAAVQFVVAVVVAVVIVAAAASAAFVAPDRVISMRLLIYVPLSIARKEIVSFYESSAVFLFLPEGGVVPFLDVI